MSDIYARSAGVAIWLGNDNPDDAQHTMSFFRNIESTDLDLSPFLLHTNESSGPISFSTLESKVRDEWKNLESPGNILYSPSVRLRNRDAFNVFFSNSYWTRLWIVQEMFLAPRITVIWCSHHVRWIAIKRFIDFRPGWRGVVPTPAVIRHSRPIWVGNRRRYDLLWLLQNFSSHGCSDPRDKVFGLLAIVKSDLGIKVDYKLDIMEVFVEAAIGSLRATAATYNNTIDHFSNQLKRWFHIISKLRMSMLPKAEPETYDIEELMSVALAWRSASSHVDLSEDERRVQEVMAKETIVRTFKLPEI